MCRGEKGLRATGEEDGGADIEASQFLGFYR